MLIFQDLSRRKASLTYGCHVIQFYIIRAKEYSETNSSK